MESLERDGPTTGSRLAHGKGLERSRELFLESSQHLAAGVSSTLRRAVRPTPLFVTHGQGAWLFDVDENAYLDYTLAYGPLILGHAPRPVVDAVAQAAALGSTFGAQHRGEIELARRVTELVPVADLTCFANSGTEAVLIALRLARAYTGRQRIVRFGGHYHGWADQVLAKPTGVGFGARGVTGGQSDAALTDQIVVPWNDPGALQAAFAEHPDKIAAVICEPIVCNSGCLYPRAGYLELLRRLATDHGSLLVFDEVITGFRVALGGAQELLGVMPDLATYGKALSGGYPLSAVAGRRDIMSLIGSGVVDHMGTLNGNTISLSAGIATLDELARNGGEVFARLRHLGDRLSNGLREAAMTSDVPLVVNEAGPVFHTIFTAETHVDTIAAYNRRDEERSAHFAELLLNEGVYVRPSGLWYISAAHTEADIDETIAMARRVLPRL